jgi:hypothetical protein
VQEALLICFKVLVPHLPGETAIPCQTGFECSSALYTVGIDSSLALKISLTEWPTPLCIVLWDFPDLMECFITKGKFAAVRIMFSSCSPWYRIGQNSFRHNQWRDRGVKVTWNEKSLSDWARRITVAEEREGGRFWTGVCYLLLCEPTECLPVSMKCK